MHAYRRGGREEWAGFITARLGALRECGAADRAALGLASPFYSGVPVLYILTLGVLGPLRQRGLGSALLAAMLARGARSGACTAFLHVIEHNTAALALYRANGFQQLALLPDFYYIGCAQMCAVPTRPSLLRAGSLCTCPAACTPFPAV